MDCLVAGTVVDASEDAALASVASFFDVLTSPSSSRGRLAADVPETVFAEALSSFLLPLFTGPVGRSSVSSSVSMVSIIWFTSSPP